MFCLCGCMKEVKSGNRYINGHNVRGKIVSFETRKKMALNNGMKRPEVWFRFKGNQFAKGNTFVMSREAVEASRLKRIGLKRSLEQCSNMKKGFLEKRRSYKGVSNPNYGNGEKVRGEKNPNWVPDKPVGCYGIEFTYGLKERIRFRDGYKCRICGCPQVENITSLQIHHIDYDKKNSEDRNLISLCNRCHSKTNFNREKWINYFKGILLSEHLGKSGQ